MNDFEVRDLYNQVQALEVRLMHWKKKLKRNNYGKNIKRRTFFW